MSDKEKEDIDKDDEFTDSYIEFYIYASTVFIIVYIGLLIRAIIKNKRGEIKWLKLYIFALTCILAILLILFYYIFIKTNTRITKYIEKAIHIYFNDYEDISLLTIASLLSLALYNRF